MNSTLFLTRREFHNRHPESHDCLSHLVGGQISIEILINNIRFERQGWFQERNKTKRLENWKYYFGTGNIDIKPTWLQILSGNTFEDLRICCSEYKGSHPIHFKSPMLVEPRCLEIKSTWNYQIVNKPEIKWDQTLCVEINHTDITKRFFHIFHQI